VAMKSSTMQTIAAGKVPELAKVFSSICGRSIAVKLEVLGKSQPQPTATLQSPPPTAPSVITPPPAPPLPSVDPAPPAPLASPPIPAAGEYLDEDESDVEVDDDLLAEPAAISSATPSVAATPIPVPPVSEPIQLVPPVAPSSEIQPVESASAIEEPPADFAEPPDSMDIERAATHLEESESPEIDDLLQSATDRIVTMFNGEIIDRQHELFEQIIN
jgi:hypothetical protein